ncbi:peptide chain release factor N(5)-glutamine methyltransferase [Coxiella endosymbiont of Amblyomma sculptum]|uniref:peptide chain release factor N(5)-glutamine methyltransferase n=1 Tax=Coxiella endosymbiont of Amblyomma sculptum TaxID=2487929 RepID=UPI00132F28EF|nr:peptide chain release factor N(5)-glutamine methyltransferase [Coxiella endosymbiont of Amblyomma sculptum]QHG92399.1 peptide chain release factor N(5)-glutamine methyltransferase [Coxiella endosymbiont of Amblyomma sculptum]
MILIKEMINRVTQKLMGFSETENLDAQILIGAALKKSRTELFVCSNMVLTKKQQERIMRYVERRISGEPIAYILGTKEFWSLRLTVNPDVFIPRPETELLVESVLNLFPKSENIRLADLGTGSGAIALALAYECPLWRIDAVDNSSKALRIAKTNAERYKMKNINFYLGEWCKALPKRNYHAIVGNPPYISDKDRHFQKLKYEPWEALSGGPDGISKIRTIVKETPEYLKFGGWLLLEHGFDQSKRLFSLMKHAGYQKIRNYKDLSGLPRIIAGRTALS